MASALLALGLVAMVLSLCERLDLAEQSLKVEAALGATSRQAVSSILRRALQRARIPLIVQL